MGAILNRKSTSVPICRTIRIGLVGDPLSGKTSLQTRFTSNRFSYEYQHTQKNTIGIKSYMLDEVSVPVTVELWELQSDFNQPIDIALIVVDSNLDIDEIQDYYMRWLEEGQSRGWAEIHVALTKSDINASESEGFLEKVSDALVLSSNQKAFLTSASSNMGILQMFKTIISQKLRSY